MKRQSENGMINDMAENDIVESLQKMTGDPKYLSEPTIKSGQPVSFVDFHLGFLRAHPALKPQHYLANLRLILKK
jgi:hypothetical protein